MDNISLYGLRVQLTATFTFPGGITLTQFAHDTDPLDLPSMQIGDKAMGINGDLILWSKASPILVNLGVIPNSVDDNNLQILFNANRPGRGKLSVQDTINLVITYPEGNIVLLNNGLITDGMPANSGSSDGRLKSKTYSFAFENLTGAA